MTKKVQITIISILILLAIPICYSFLIVPSFKQFNLDNPTYTNLMKYRLSQAKKQGYQLGVKYSFVPLQEIPTPAVEAVIFAEDSMFFQHHGIDFSALRDSFFMNQRRHRIVLGGSTITMQLCKNLFLSPQKTYSRKLTEIILAWRMENALPKKRILELYLNLIEWGDGIFGIENASWYYFNKPARELDLEESATLAAIITNPQQYNPEKTSPYFEYRKKRILNYLLTGDRFLRPSEEDSEELLDAELDAQLAESATLLEEDVTGDIQ